VRGLISPHFISFERYKMNTDAYYEIGSTHTENQDYAISGIIRKNLAMGFNNNDVAYAIVSDGCSGSPGSVTFGARLLAYTAASELCHSGLFSNDTNGFGYDDMWYPKKFNVQIEGERISTKVGNTLKLMNLRYETMDATVVAVVSNGINAKVYMWGDGSVIIRQRSGRITVHNINYESGAPHYLSYLRDFQRQENYIKETEGKVKQHICITSDTEDPVVMEVPVLEGMTFSFDIEADDIECIAVASDGLETFNKDEEFKSTLEMAKEFVNYKGYKGTFVSRRLRNGLGKRCKKEGINHSDDIACAAIHFPNPETKEEEQS
jgi:hypothetical protein